MPSNLDLAAIKADMSELLNAGGIDIMLPERYAALKDVAYRVFNAAPALVDEVERLTAENETLKADPTGSYAMGEQKIVDLLGIANARIESLRQQLATAEANARDFEAVCMGQEGQIARLMQEVGTAKAEGAASEEDDELRIFRAMRHKERNGLL